MIRNEPASKHKLRANESTEVVQPPAQEEDDGPSTSLGRRLRSPHTIVSFIIAFALIAFIFRNLDVNFGAIWANLGNANPLYVAVGFVAYYLTFPLRSARWRRLLTNAGISREHGYRVPHIVGLSEIYLLSWFANCLVPAKLGDAYRGYLLKKNAGPSFGRTVGTIFAERVMDVFALVALMVVAVLLVFRGTFPASLQIPMVAGIGLVVIGILGLGALFWFGHGIQRRMPERIRPYYIRVQDGIQHSFSRTGLTGVVVLTIFVWLLEGVRIFMVATAFGVTISPAESMLIALLASLLTIVPFTPAGLGVVEGGTIVALKLLDISDTNATTIALIDRGIAYWSVIAIGAILYLVSKRK